MDTLDDMSLVSCDTIVTDPHIEPDSLPRCEKSSTTMQTRHAQDRMDGSNSAKFYVNNFQARNNPTAVRFPPI